MHKCDSDISADGIKARFNACTSGQGFRTKSAKLAPDQVDDNKPLRGDTHVMNDITREELTARLETIETKMDARVESVSSKIDAFISVQAERDKRLESTINLISANHTEIKSSLSSMKTTMIVTAVTVVLTIVIGVAGFNAMLTSNMVASFQMGRSELAFQKQQPTPAPTSAPASTPPASR